MNNQFSFKTLFLCYTFFSIPFFFTIGLLSLFNLIPVELNGINYFGFIGFTISLLFIPIFGFLFSCLNWVVLNLGLKFYNLVLRMTKK